MRQFFRAGGVILTLLASGALSAAASPNGMWGAKPEQQQQISFPSGEAIAQIGDSVFVAFFISGDTSQATVFRGGAKYKTCGSRVLSARFYRDSKLTNKFAEFQKQVNVCGDTTKTPPPTVPDTTPPPCWVSDPRPDGSVIGPVCDTTKAPPRPDTLSR